jgi:hypothetical protein
MRSIRLRKAVVAGAVAVATVTPLALISSIAGATSGTTTSTTVTGPSSVGTGQASVFTATVSPNTTGASPVVKATGTVTFTITGKDASSVACNGGDAVSINGKGKALCKVAGGSLEASASTYSVAAVYSGDSNFAGSTATPMTLTVNPDKPKLHLSVTSGKPTSGVSSTFKATINVGKAGSLLGGKVQFVVADTPAQPKAKRTCQGGSNQPVAVSGNVGTATCILPAGWFVVPAPTKTTEHPRGAWTVTAAYLGNGNFVANSVTRSGTSNH